MTMAQDWTFELLLPHGMMIWVVFAFEISGPLVVLAILVYVICLLQNLVNLG